MFKYLSVLATVTIVGSTVPALAHEFWVSPERYQVEAKAPIIADIRVGELFKGAGYSYIPNRTNRFDVVKGGQAMPVTSRMGDRPALNMVQDGEGLITVVHETMDQTVIYREWDKFVNFVTHKDFQGVLDQHAARGLPDTLFQETYRRYAKSLVAVGHGKGQDSAVGLTTEIVALANPYTDELSSGMPVQVLFEGHPRVNAQLEVFERAPDGTVTDTTYRTDTDGRAVVPVKADHEYLLDAVILQDTGNNDAEAGPVWHSLWASLTFKVPAGR